MVKKQRKNLPKWLRVTIPVVLIAVWLGLAGIGGPYFGKIEEVSDSDLSAFLPESSEAYRVSEASAQFRSDETIPAITLFESSSGEQLSAEQISALEEVVTQTEAVEGVSSEASPLTMSDDGKAAFAIIPIDTNGEVDQTIVAIGEVINSNEVAGVNHWVTGPAGFLADLSAAFAGIDGILLLVALGVVFVILLIVYRSPLLPFIVLLVSICALATALLLVWWLAKWDVLQLNGQVQGILFILVIGAATDYSLLLVSRYREELYVHEDKGRALVGAWRGVLEPITASGGTVIVGLLCLLVSDLGSNKALGPVGSIGILFSMLAALTLLPALLYVFGRAGFWPRAPRTDRESVAAHNRRQESGIWNRIGEFVARYPRPIWIVTALVLAVATTGVVQLRADGVSQSDLILGYSEARDGQAALNRHFPDGSGSPVLVLVSSDQQDKAVIILDADPGVDGVSATATGVTAGFKLLGEQAASIKADIKAEISKELDQKRAEINTQADEIASAAGPFAGEIARQQFLDSVLPNIPTADELVQEAYPFSDATVTTIGDKVLLSATLVDEPYSAEAEATVTRIRETMQSRVGQEVLVGGTTATTIDTNSASLRDRTIIIPLVLVAITIILMVLLRSLIAPILLLATTVLSFGASLGVSALLFNHVWNFPGADPSVILYGFVFLVALGIDYNIFLMTRVREESKKIGTRKGVIKGLVVTGGVITSAGVVLAATFAALSVIPILFLAQLAFVVAFGVLLDTIVVRSLLVPALIRDIGGFVWWPSKLRHKD